MTANTSGKGRGIVGLTGAGGGVLPGAAPVVVGLAVVGLLEVGYPELGFPDGGDPPDDGAPPDGGPPATEKPGIAIPATLYSEVGSLVGTLTPVGHGTACTGGVDVPAVVLPDGGETTVFGTTCIGVTIGGVTGVWGITLGAVVPKKLKNIPVHPPDCLLPDLCLPDSLLSESPLPDPTRGD
ncbi:hypothetical protein R1sor_027490 [Riccia sorocarpa]|uniref:Uncharacterized protein n=1 Tax=Riccia sorocarpa TaxID=122646 RepID=A0ABD3GH79_9MARC